jgi:hypothetical protein
MAFGRNLKDDFGAVGNGASAAADTAAFNAALAAGPGTYFIPRGDYRINQTLTATSLNGYRFIGEGGDRLAGPTFVRYVGQNPSGLLVMKSCLNFDFEHIHFKAEAPCNQLIMTDALDAPNLSCHNINFNRCTISRNTGVDVPELVVLLNTVFPRFDGCWLLHADVAIFAGKNVSDSPSTIAQGAVNQLQVRNCFINCDVYLRQTLHATFEHVVWDYRHASVDGRLPVIGGNSGDQDNKNVRIIQNFYGLLDEPPSRRSFFIQGSQGRYLLAENNSIRMASTAFDLNGQGHARLSANRPISTTQLVDLHGNSANCIVDQTNN